MGILIRLAYRVRRFLWRWPTRGVRVMARDPAGLLLLVRHRYGQRDLWMLPGGGIARGETPEAAAVREVREETGCELAGVVAVGTFASWAEGRRDTVFLFRATAVGVPRPDAFEVADARFFAPEGLPDEVSPATLRRIAEEAGEREVDGLW